MLAAMAVLAGCTPEPSGPPSTQTASSEFETVAERVAFLEPYLPLERTYETLDFYVSYQNDDSAGFLDIPGPSDWDIRIVATVPASELDDWVLDGVTPVDTADTAWLSTVPTSLDTSGLTEWYVDVTRATGIDRSRRIVAYRFTTHALIAPQDPPL